MLSNLPLISIITPSFNQGQFIEETILSVLRQDYPNIEHIIIDGGSTDNTLTILKRYENSYPMRWLSEADQGQADALQKGFALCQGDILCWLNSDDIYLSSQILTRVTDLFNAYPDVDIITGGGIELSQAGRWIRQLEILPRHINYYRLRFVDHILQPATFFKKEVLDSVKIDATLYYAFDWDLFIQMSQEHNILAINEPWAGYRMWEQNKTSSGGSARSRELLEITRRYVGRQSWQWYTVKLFCIIFAGIDLMPPGGQRWLKPLIKKISFYIQVLTNHRVTAI